MSLPGSGPWCMIRARLDACRLVFVCSTVSMAPTSNLPQAREIAALCFDQYRLTSHPNCSPDLGHDLEAFAEHFVALGSSKPIFIVEIVRPRCAGPGRRRELRGPWRTWCWWRSTSAPADRCFATSQSFHAFFDTLAEQVRARNPNAIPSDGRPVAHTAA